MPEIGVHRLSLKYKEMKDKYDYMQGFSDRQSSFEIAKTLAAFGAFTEGLQLFAIIRHPAEFPALRQNEGHGPDRHLVSAR